jgi:hypothetical protein
MEMPVPKAAFGANFHYLMVDFSMALKTSMGGAPIARRMVRNSSTSRKVMCGCPPRCKRSFDGAGDDRVRHVSGLEMRLCDMPRAGMEIRRPGADQKSER